MGGIGVEGRMASKSVVVVASRGQDQRTRRRRQRAAGPRDLSRDKTGRPGRNLLLDTPNCFNQFTLGKEPKIRQRFRDG
jgi:hypothetical protein